MPRLVQDLIRENDSEEYRIIAANNLLHIAQIADGPSRIATVVIHANAMPRLVGYLANPVSSSNPIHLDLTRHTISILAYILSFRQTWQPALRTTVVPLLTARLSEFLSNPNFGPPIDIACALAKITDADGGKHVATQAGTVPLLVGALSHPSNSLVKMLVRALRNIGSIDAGRRAIYAAHGVRPLVALLDLHPHAENQVRYDAVKALSYIASIGKVARKTMKQHGAVEKLKSLPSPPLQLQQAAEDLRDDLR